MRFGCMPVARVAATVYKGRRLIFFRWVRTLCLFPVKRMSHECTGTTTTPALPVPCLYAATVSGERSLAHSDGDSCGNGTTLSSFPLHENTNGAVGGRCTAALRFRSQRK